MAGPAGAEADGRERESETDSTPQRAEWGVRANRVRPTGKANRLAVTALICSMAIPFLLVAGILGITFGFVALDEIEEAEGNERGKAIAQWAIGLGLVNIAISGALIVLVAVAVAK